MTADGSQTRARLLTEARDLYLEGGAAHFSLREVARRAGVTGAAVYRHFEGKEDLFGHVCAAGLQIFYTYLVRALSEPTPRARLAGSARQYLAFGLANPRDYRVLFMGGADDLATGAPTKKAPAPEPTFQFLVDRVSECIQAGIVRKGDPDELAAVIWAHVHGLVSLRLAGQLERVGTDAEFGVFYERAVERLIVGLQA